MPSIEDKKAVRFDIPTQEKPCVLDSFPCSATEMNQFLTKILLRQKKSGMEEMEYNKLLDSVQKKSLKVEECKMLIVAVSNFLSRDGCKELILALISIDWLDKRQNFVSSYLHFLQNVVSVNPVFIAPVINMLVEILVSGKQQYPEMTSETIFDRAHNALIKILKLIPRGPVSILLPILKQKLPHKSDSTITQRFYIKSLLYITEYAPIIRNNLLTLILDLLVQIDIEIQVDDLEDDEDEEDIFSMEMGKETNIERDSGNSSDEYDSNSDAGSILLITSEPKKMISKLDSLICVMFDYITTLSKKTQINSSIFPDVFDTLLEIFNRIMLPTHKLRSVQFIIFYSCSLEPNFCQDFLGSLVSHLVEPTFSPIGRIASSSYLGSFIARAKFIEIASVRQCLLILNKQCQDYVDLHEHTIKGKYGPLYGSVQAMLYIFCFRWKFLMLVDDKPLSGAFPAELNGFQRVLLSKFNPLRVCSEVIVSEFAKITNHLNVMYCYPLFQTSSSKSDAPTTYSAQELSVLKRLDTFFPFDPMFLPVAKTYIQDCYQEWEVDDRGDSELSNSLKNMSFDDRMSICNSVSIN